MRTWSIVPTSQIELGEVPCISKLIEEVINAKDGILVLDGDLIKGLVVDA